MNAGGDPGAAGGPAAGPVPARIGGSVRLCVANLSTDQSRRIILKAVEGSPLDMATFSDARNLADYRRSFRMFSTGRVAGYVAEQTVIDAATKAGFKFDGKSEANANPKDTKDHPFGVWTLPPTRQSSPNAQTPVAADFCFIAQTA